MHNLVTPASVAPPIAPRTPLHCILGARNLASSHLPVISPVASDQPRPGPVLEMTLDTAITDTGRREHAGSRLWLQVGTLAGPGSVTDCSQDRLRPVSGGGLVSSAVVILGQVVGQ